MPPKRARSASVGSTDANASTSAPPKRRSSRPSIAPAPKTAPRNPPAPPRRARRATSVLSSVNGSDDEAAAGPASKKRRGSNASSAPRVKKVVAPKPPRPAKPLPAPIQGLNPLPERWSLFPAPSSFTAAVGFEPVPAHGDAPRQIAIWGDGNMSGQLGMGDELTAADEPVRLRTLDAEIRAGTPAWKDGPAATCAGGMHTLMIDSNGDVSSFGNNDGAALGRRTEGLNSDELEGKPMPVQDQHLDILDTKPTGVQGHPFKAVRCYAGDSVSLAQDERGRLKAWGTIRNAQGLLGFGEFLKYDEKEEKVVKKIVKRQWQPSALSAFAQHSFVQVSCGDDHYLALTTTGYVFTAGGGEQGELGRKVSSRYPIAPVRPERLSFKNVVLVGAGAFHSFLVDKAGDVYGFGNNTYRQTGVATEDGGAATIIEKPTLIQGLSPAEHDGARVVQIAGGAFHTVFLFSNGEVWTVGRADEGEVGLADDHPELVAMRQRRADAQIKQDAWKETNRKKYFADDGVTVDYYNKQGDLMTVAEVDAEVEQEAATEFPLPNNYVATPQRVEFSLEPATWDAEKTQDDYDDEPELCTEPTRIIHVASAGQHSIAVSARGYVYTWGLGIMDQLGTGGTEREATPRRILNKVLKQLRAIKAEAGGQHCLVVGVSRDWENKKAAKAAKAAAAAAAASAAAAAADGAGDVDMADAPEGAEQEEVKAAGASGELEPIVEG